MAQGCLGHCWLMSVVSTLLIVALWMTLCVDSPRPQSQTRAPGWRSFWLSYLVLLLLSETVFLSLSLSLYLPIYLLITAMGSIFRESFKSLFHFLIDCHLAESILCLTDEATEVHRG